MASTSSTIKIIFDGTARGVIAAAGRASAAIRRLNVEQKNLEKVADATGSGLLKVGKGFAALSAAGSAAKMVAATAGAAQQLAPVALLLPGALLGGAAAMGTFKLATAGMGDALKAGLSGDMEKFAEATKDMAPAMRDSAKAVADFKPQVDDLRKSVQGAFWDDFSGQITQLGNRYLPILKTGMSGVSRSLGTMVFSASAAMNNNLFSGAVVRIFDNTTASINNMSPALGKILKGFIQLGAVGSDYLPRLGTAIDAVATKFSDWVSSTSDEQLKALIDGAIQGFRDLGAIAGNVGSILGSVFRGLGGDISSPLASLRELTGQAAAFLKTVEAQEGLRALGETLRVVGDVVGRVVMTALRELMPTLVALAPVAQEVARTLGDLLVGALTTAGPIIRGIADVLKDYPGVVSAATVAVVGFVAAMKTIKVINAATDLLGVERLFGRVGKAAGGAGKTTGISWGKGLKGGLGLVGLGVGGTLLADALIPKDVSSFGSQTARDMLGQMAKTFSGEEGNIFRTWDVAKWVSSPLQMAIDLGTRVLSGFGASAWQPFVDWTGRKLDEAVAFVTGLPGRIGAALSSLGSSIAGAASSAWNTLVTATSTAFDAVVAFVVGLPARAGAALSSLGASIAGAATGAWNSLVTATSTAIDSVVAFVTDLPFKVGFALGSLAGIIASAAISAWNMLVTATTTAVNATVAFVSSLPARAGAALAALGAAIVSVATSAWASFTSAVVAGAAAAVNFVRSVPGLVAGALSALASSIVSVASAAWNAFRNAVVAGVNAVVAFVRSVPGLIVSALSTLVGMLTSSAASAANGFSNGLRNGFNAAVAFVRGIPGAIAGALGNLAGLLVGAGRSIIDGLLAGIRAGVSAMYSFVSGIAAGIAARKGPLDYDRRLLVPAGLAIMQGLSTGLRTGFADVLAVAAAAGSSISEQLSTTVSPPVQMASTGLSLSAPDPAAAALRQLFETRTDSTPIQVTVLLDGQPVRDIARTEIRTANRETRREVGAGAGATW